MKTARIFIALAATIGSLAMAPAAFAAEASSTERAAPQRVKTATASVTIARAKTFTFSNKGGVEGGMQSKNTASRSELVRECKPQKSTTTEGETPACASMLITDLH